MNYDLLTIQESSSSIKSNAGKIDSFKNSDIQRVGIRRFEGGKIFQASRLGASTLDQLIADTREWGGPGIPHDYGFAPAAKESRKSEANISQVFEDFEACLEKVRTQFPEYVFKGGCEKSSSQISLTSDYGLDLHTSGSHSEWYIMYQLKGSGNVIDGYFGETSIQPQVKEVFDSQLKYLELKGKKAKLESGKLPVLFTAPTEPIDKLIESLRINTYQEKAGLFSGKMGEKLFHDKINLIDSAYDPRIGKISFFDGEGSLRKDDNLTLVKNGKITGLMSDLRFAKKYHSTSSANGRRAYNSGVNVMSQSLRFAAGEKPWQEILNSLDRCLVAVVAAGGDTNDLGEFSTPVQIGYIFEKGQLVGLAPQLTVKSTVSNYLGAGLIDVASNGFYRDSAGAAVISEMYILIS